MNFGGVHFEHCQTSLTCLFIRPDALDSPGTTVDYKPLDIVRHLLVRYFSFYLRNVQNMMAMNNDHDVEVYFMKAFILF